jgi:hypothetical protein
MPDCTDVALIQLQLLYSSARHRTKADSLCCTSLRLTLIAILQTQAKTALILAPKSVMRGWETELNRWLVAACPSVQVVVLSSEMLIARRRNIVK